MQVLASPGLARVFVGCRNGSGGLEGCRPLGELFESTGFNRSFNLQLQQIARLKSFLHLTTYFASDFSCFSLLFPALQTHSKHCNKFQNKTRF